jgi:predicted 2-oxoglutarate/Fe(II)-dependent dioxygenase YbiX
LIKYKQGDFFLTHGDRNLSDALEGIIHKYTSLLFCPYDTYEGGELIFTHPEELYEIKFNPRIETNNGKFVMIIFSIDMLHKVLPIISGTRCVFKKPLFVKSDSNIIKKENNYKDCVDTLDDGGWTCTSGGGGGDY